MTIKLEAGSMSVMLPAGRYLIGDPAVALEPEQFDAALLNSNDFQDQCFGYWDDGTRKGVVIAFSCSTDVAVANGTTVFLDNSEATHESESGYIAIIPVVDVANRYSNMHVYQFASAFLCYEENGMLVFGDIYIDANYDESGVPLEDEELDEPDFTFDGDDEDY